MLKIVNQQLVTITISDLLNDRSTGCLESYFEIVAKTYRKGGRGRERKWKKDKKEDEEEKEKE